MWSFESNPSFDCGEDDRCCTDYINAVTLTGFDGDQFCGSGVQSIADSREGGEADGFGLVCLKDGQIRHGYAGSAGEFRECHAALSKDMVKVALDAVFAWSLRRHPIGVIRSLTFRQGRLLLPRVALRL